MSEDLSKFTITPPKLKSKRRIKSLLFVLKTLACVLGPLTVPTIVYGFEGYSALFWWMLGISCITSLLLTTFDIQKAKNLIEYLKISKCGGIRCMIRIGFIVLLCAVGIYAYHIHFYEMFSVCLFVTGVITGTFFSDITAWWNFRTKKNLPYMNFTKDSPAPVRPTFLDLRRNSFNLPNRNNDSLPLKRQLSSPMKQSSNILTFSNMEEVKSSELPVLAETSPISQTEVLFGFPSSSSSGESDVADVSRQAMITTPPKRRVIAAESIYLSPIINAMETSPISKKRLEFPANSNPTQWQPIEISHLQTPTFTYTDCSVDNLSSQNFSFFHM